MENATAPSQSRWERAQEATQHSPEMRSLSIRLPKSERTVSIDVRGAELRFGGEVAPAEVNWPGIGSVGSEDADAFAAGLAYAAKMAGELAPSHAAFDKLADAEAEALGPDPMDDPAYVRFMGEEEARGELAGSPREMLCYECRPGEGLMRPVVKLGPIAEPHRDPTQTYVLGCGHTAIDV